MNYLKKIPWGDDARSIITSDMTKTKKKAILMTTNVESTDYSVNVHNHLIFNSLYFIIWIKLGGKP